MGASVKGAAHWQVRKHQDSPPHLQEQVEEEPHSLVVKNQINIHSSVSVFPYRCLALV